MGKGAFAAIGTALAVFGLWALVFARSSSTGWIADQSALVVQVDSAITDLEITHERLKQAVVLGAAVDAGVVPELLAGATDDLRAVVPHIDRAALEQRLREAGGPLKGDQRSLEAARQNWLT